MLPLILSKPGENVDICSLTCSSAEARRLREMGCIEGIRAVIISNQKNVILQVGDMRLAINGDLARTILVSPK